MKKVKDYLFELNTTELVDTFFELYSEKLYDLYYFNNPTNYDDEHIQYDETVRELTVFEFAQAKRKELFDYIRYLKDIEIKEIPNGKTGVIYAYGAFERCCFDRWQIGFIFLEDLLADPENCRNRNFSNVKFSEVLGFSVADNEFTQDIIYKVIACVLNVVSVTGFRQENREKHLQMVKENNGEYGLYKPIEERSGYLFYDNPALMDFICSYVIPYFSAMFFA